MCCNVHWLEMYKLLYAMRHLQQILVPALPDANVVGSAKLRNENKPGCCFNLL